MLFVFLYLCDWLFVFYVVVGLVFLIFYLVVTSIIIAKSDSCRQIFIIAETIIVRVVVDVG